MSNGIIINTESAASDIAFVAEKQSNDKNYMSPFARKAKEQNLRYSGGKPDDITIIVAQVDIGNMKDKLLNKRL